MRYAARSRPLLVLATLGLGLVAACGDGDQETGQAAASETPREAASAALTEGERVFLADVRAIDARIDTQFKELVAILSRSWPVPSVFCAAFSAGNLTDVLATGLADLRDLTAPDRFEDDQQIIVTILAGAVAHSEALDQAVDEENFVGLIVSASELQVARGRLVNTVSPTFCANALVLESDAAGGLGCPETEGLSGGEYGIAVYGLMRTYASEFGPRAGSFPISVSDEELALALLAQQPEIIAVLETTRTALAGLEVPAEFEDDHARLLTYFDQTTALSREITRAAEDREGQRLLNEPFPESGDIACNAYTGFSESFRQLLAPFFGSNAPDFC